MTKTINLDPYRPEVVPLFEAIYGQNFISLGGSAAIENMFRNVKLTRLTALDVGFGLGGVAYYLTANYNMHITGIEIHPWMKDYAQSNAPNEISERLKFLIYEPQESLPFADQSFDIVYSKGVLNHVKEKQHLFQEIYSKLKPNGQFIIADWIYPEYQFKATEPLAYESQDSYQQVFKNAGFTDISFDDDSQVFIIYVQNFLLNLDKKKVFITDRYGEEAFSIIRKQHEDLLEDMHQHRKMAIRIDLKYLLSKWLARANEASRAS